MKAKRLLPLPIDISIEEGKTFIVDEKALKLLTAQSKLIHIDNYKLALKEIINDAQDFKELNGLLSDKIYLQRFAVKINDLDLQY